MTWFRESTPPPYFRPVGDGLNGLNVFFPWQISIDSSVPQKIKSGFFFSLFAYCGLKSMLCGSKSIDPWHISIDFSRPWSEKISHMDRKHFQFKSYAEIGHQMQDCQAEKAKCCHCGGDHVARSRDCSKHQLEQKVLDVVQKQRVTHQRARQIINEKPITRTSNNSKSCTLRCDPPKWHETSNKPMAS